MEVLSVDNKIMTVNGKLAKAPSTTRTGDMKKSVYDSTGIVEETGGIPDYNVPNEGILPLIANDGSIVPTGTYATSRYYDTSYGVKVGYMSNGDVMISMKNGTTTSYENIYFHAASLPTGVTLDAPSTFDTGNVVGMTFVGIISGLTGLANIAIDMSTTNGTYDYVRCDLTITYV